MTMRGQATMTAAAPKRGVISMLMGNSNQNKYGGVSHAKPVIGQQIAGGKKVFPAVNQQG